jgi:hypothetical protein
VGEGGRLLSIDASFTHKYKPLKGEKMKNSKNRTTATVIAIFLVLTIAVTLIALPAANAHTPPWTIPTYAYIKVTPNPIGISQSAFIVMWIDKIPPTAGGSGGDRWTNYTVKVTAPNGDIETLGPFISDPTSSAYQLFTPDQVGTYKFDFNFPGQVATGVNPVTGEPAPADTLARGGGAYINDTYLGSNATTTLTVQQEPVTEPPIYPLATEYWTRPIEGQNTAWASIASNWLGGVFSRDVIIGVQPDGIAPNSPHIMWTKPLQFGGIVGGNNTAIPSEGYYTGLTYEIRFTDPVIIQGRLYYSFPLANNAKGGGYVCVDLLTGETIWQNDAIRPSFGQLYDYETPNQHGVVGSGMLWEIVGVGDKWNAYDPFTGKSLFNLTGVPSGKSLTGSDGSIDIYVLNAAAGWLAMWNNTAAPGELLSTTGTEAWQWRPVGKTIDASKAYSWNVTIPTAINLTGSAIVEVIPNDLVLGRGQISGVGGFGTPDPYTVWAISDKPASRGQLLWIKNYPAPAGNITRTFGPVDPVNRVFTMRDKETTQWWGYSLNDGSLLWGPTPSEDVFDYYGTPAYTAYGNLYFSGYAGVLYCVSMKNGNLLWSYGNGGAGNSTFSAHETPWGNYPLFIATIADGKVYVTSGEHSPNTPLYKGSRVRCINATTGEEMWTLASWAGSPSYFERIALPVADGYMAYLNAYDMQVYCIGKGPSATTVTAAPTVLANGDSVLIKGTVIDTADGTKQEEQAARFPNGVPAVSDAGMGEWMEYVYMQKPMPTDATGVEVTLDAVDPNGNFIHIDTVTSDTSGGFKKLWQPEIPGEYTIIATFQGSESYYASYAETYIGITEAPAATPTPTPAADTTMTIIGTGVGTGIAVIIAIAIAVVLLLRKK